MSKTTRRLRRFHASRIVVWTIQVPVAMTTDLKKSTPYLVFLSLAALIEGAFASYMSARAEEAAGD